MVSRPTTTIMGATKQRGRRLQCSDNSRSAGHKHMPAERLVHGAAGPMAKSGLATALLL